MAVELVTGATGSDHVSSDDAAHLHAGIVGRGSYALGGAPEVSMTDANTLSIPACDLVLEGRHVRLTGITEAKVASGGQSAHRRDLVCLRYALDQSRQVESASVVVVQGQVAYSAAAARDPELPSKGSILALDPTVDVPIARVTLDGLSPAAEWLLPVVPPLASLADDTGWADLHRDMSGSGGGYYVRWRVVRGVCFLSWDLIGANGSGWYCSRTIPREYMPDEVVYAPSGVYGSNDTALVWVPKASAGDGRIWFSCRAASGRMVGSASWPCSGM